jgi:hypothetical protein
MTYEEGANELTTNYTNTNIFLLERCCTTSRLREEGFEVPKIPNLAEIEEAKRKYELKKEISDIDQSLILTNGKRRLDDQSGSSSNDKLFKDARSETVRESAPSVAPHDNEVNSSTKKMKPSHDSGEDEEAEAHF